MITKNSMILNKFFFSAGTGLSGNVNYFYKDSCFYRIDTFHDHDYEGICDFQNKIDNNISFYEDINFDEMEPGYKPPPPGSLPYPQLSNGKMYDAMGLYTKKDANQEYITNIFQKNVIDEDGFNFFNLKESYRPKERITDSIAWGIMIDVDVNGENFSKTVSGYHIFPDESEGIKFFGIFLDNYNNNSNKIETVQNIINPNPRKINRSLMQKIKNILTT